MLNILIAFLLIFAQQARIPGPGGAPAGGGGSNPALVNTASNWSGSGSVSISVTAGNHLVVWTIANDTTITHTCSDSATNTYVYDAALTKGAGGAAVAGRIAHVKTLATSASITITCTGTTPAVAAAQYSGGSGDLDTTSVGTNPSTCNTSSPCTPSAFTPTTTATILVDTFGASIGGTITLAQVDTNFTTNESCLTGASCFVGALGTRVVSSSASYSDGWTITGGNSDELGILAAYK